MQYTLEQARILGSFTQVNLAEKLGMSEKTYIQYEKYRKILRYDHAFKFAKLTNIPIDNIIFFEEQVQKNCS